MFDLMFGAAVVAVVLGVTAGGYLFCCAMEANTFNRLTGASVTTWDAMWVELRVDVPVIRGE
jgi:hypothetical protein